VVGGGFFWSRGRVEDTSCVKELWCRYNGFVTSARYPSLGRNLEGTRNELDTR
jgi:hypothetical protein